MADFSDSPARKTRSALAIFCRAPRLGTVKTRIAQTRGNEFALELYRAMLADTFALGRALSPDVETFACFTPNDGFEGENSLAGLWDGPKIAQCEGDLGAKILDCFAQLRALGFEKIVVIGSDSPDLPVLRLKRAFEDLDIEPMILFGPARDGGFYLMGASLVVPSYLFQEVEWSQNDTLSAIEHNHQQQTPPRIGFSELNYWHDVDDEDDLQELNWRLFELGAYAPRTRDFLARS